MAYFATWTLGMATGAFVVISLEIAAIKLIRRFR